VLAEGPKALVQHSRDVRRRVRNILESWYNSERERDTASSAGSRCWPPSRVCASRRRFWYHQLQDRRSAMPRIPQLRCHAGCSWKIRRPPCTLPAESVNMEQLQPGCRGPRIWLSGGREASHFGPDYRDILGCWACCEDRTSSVRPQTLGIWLDLGSFGYMNLTTWHDCLQTHRHDRASSLKLKCSLFLGIQIGQAKHYSARYPSTLSGKWPGCKSSTSR